MQRMLLSKVLSEAIDFVPASARDAAVDLRDYVREHGRLPKFQPLRRTAIRPGEIAQAISVFMGTVEAGASLRMVNLLKGDVNGGSVRGGNVILGDVHGGELRAVNLILGAVRGGTLRGVNMLLGDLHAGEAKSVYVMIGNVYGGELSCRLLIGDVHGGVVRTKFMVGQKLGGDTEVERALDESERP